MLTINYICDHMQTPLEIPGPEPLSLDHDLPLHNPYAAGTMTNWVSSLLIANQIQVGSFRHLVCLISNFCLAVE